MAKNSAIPVTNRLLTALPAEEYKRLLPYLEIVSLKLKQVLYEPREPIRHIYFPNNGIVSLLSVLEDNASVEVATVGNEGLIGLPVFQGVGTTFSKAIVQLAGDAMRMEAEVFIDLVAPGSPLYSLLQRYTYALMAQMAQSVACNRRHCIEERCCRWLLICHDRAGSDKFPLIQEFMAQMLGVRRASVTVVFGMFQKAGLIHHSKGTMTILDRQGLEAASCECYKIVKEFDCLIG